MSNYDAWQESQYTDQPHACENCDDEGCHLCDKQMAEDYYWSTDPRV